MVSKSDLLIGVLVLLTGCVMHEFTPTNAGGGGILLARFGMEPGHYIGSALAILFGIIGLALYRKVNKVTIAVSVLSILLGLLFLAIMNNWPLHTVFTPHAVAMASIADLTLLVGIIGTVGSVAIRTKKPAS
jgi:hypothetical protein